jgi:hypothetical protein
MPRLSSPCQNVWSAAVAISRDFEEHTPVLFPRISESAKVAPPILAKPSHNLRCSANCRVIKSLYPLPGKNDRGTQTKVGNGCVPFGYPAFIPPSRSKAGSESPLQSTVPAVISSFSGGMSTDPQRLGVLQCGVREVRPVLSLYCWYVWNGRVKLELSRPSPLRFQSCNTTAVTSSHMKYDWLLRLPCGHSIRFDRYPGLLLHD